MIAADRSGAIEIADRVWWVGSVRPDDTFQCHAYLIDADDNSVLIDPGSVLSIDETLRRAGEVVPLSSIRWVVCHHSDPDIAGGLSIGAQGASVGGSAVGDRMAGRDAPASLRRGHPVLQGRGQRLGVAARRHSHAALRADSVPPLSRCHVLVRGVVWCAVQLGSVRWLHRRITADCRGRLVLRVDAAVPRALHAEPGDPRCRAVAHHSCLRPDRLDRPTARMHHPRTAGRPDVRAVGGARMRHLLDGP